jgi:hypothetical protein
MQKGTLRGRAPGTGGVHGAGLASAFWPSPRENLHSAPLAPVAILLFGRGDDWGLALGLYVLPYGIGWLVERCLSTL